MRFNEAYQGWKRGHLTQEEAGLLLGMSERNFRRYVERYHKQGEAGLLDKRLTQASHRCAPVDEVTGSNGVWLDIWVFGKTRITGSGLALRGLV